MNNVLPQYLKQQPKATIVIVTGPSGVGKDTILTEIAKQPNVRRIITTTTRPMRDFEKEGDPYYFVNTEEFQKLIENKELFEHDFHYGHWYGITHNELREKIQHEGIVLWKVDTNGMKTISKLLPFAITIGIIPDSKSAAEQRYRKRGSDTEKDLEKRLKEDVECISFLQKNAKHLVVNKEGKPDEAVKDFLHIINKYTQ